MNNHIQVRHRLALKLGAAVSILAMAAIGCSSMPATETDGGEESRVLKVVAVNQNDIPYEAWELFAAAVEEESGGTLAFDLSDYPTLGFAGGEALSMLSEGTADILDIVPGYISGEAPVIEGVQLVGALNGIDQSEEAWRSWVTALDENAVIPDAKVLGSYGWECIYMWSTRPIENLTDLNGMTVRALGSAQAGFLNEFGATAVQLGIEDLYPALQTGAVDAMVGGAKGGIRLSLPEVASYLVDMNFGCTGGLAAINSGVWESLSENQQSALLRAAEKFTNKGWELSHEASETGVSDNIALGVEFTAVKPEWAEAIAEASRTIVLPEWTSRSGEAGVELFNEVVAPLAGFSAD